MGCGNCRAAVVLTEKQINGNDKSRENYSPGFAFWYTMIKFQGKGWLLESHFHLVTYRKRPSTVQSLIKRYFSDNVGRSAAALAYYLIFSLFPFLILISSIISFLDLPDLTVESFKGLIPVDIIELANSYLSHISEIKNASLLLFGFVFTIYFTMRAVNCLLQSIHRAYRVKSKFSFWRHQLHVFLTTIFLIVIVFVALGLMTFGKNLLTWLSGWIPIDMGSISLWNLLRFVILAAVLFMVLLTLYLSGSQPAVYPA